MKVRVWVVIMFSLVVSGAMAGAENVTCNPEPTFWPCDISGPEEWGIPCPAAVTEYTVSGRVTVYEDAPLEGAEVRVNRIVDGAQTGAGMAMSDAEGEYRIEISGHVDALRIYVIYPPEYEPWGVTAPVGSWGMELIHWVDPPALCGPIHWKAAYKETKTPSPSRTKTPSPSRTKTPSPSRTKTPSPSRTKTPSPSRTKTPSPSRTKTPSPSRTETATMTPTVKLTPTVYSVILPQLIRMTPASTQLGLMQQHVILGVGLYNLAVVAVGAGLMALAAMGFIKIKQKDS